MKALDTKPWLDFILNYKLVLETEGTHKVVQKLLTKIIKKLKKNFHFHVFLGIYTCRN